MATLKEEIEAIKSLQDGIVNNKVANFAYTDEAYTENKADGVEIYDINKPQNIPVPDPDVLKVNPTILTKGYRAQASSVTRMLINHFFGRTSYNLNKVNDFFLSLLTKLSAYLGTANGIATLDSNAKVPVGQLQNIIDDYIDVLDPLLESHRRTFSVFKINSLFKKTEKSIEALSSEVNASISDITDSKGQANGIASLDENAKVPVEQLQNIINDSTSSNQKTYSSEYISSQLISLSGRHTYVNYIELKGTTTSNVYPYMNGTGDLFFTIVCSEKLQGKTVQAILQYLSANYSNFYMSATGLFKFPTAKGSIVGVDIFGSKFRMKIIRIDETSSVPSSALNDLNTVQFDTLDELTCHSITLF